MHNHPHSLPDVTREERHHNYHPLSHMYSFCRVFFLSRSSRTSHRIAPRNLLCGTVERRSSVGLGTEEQEAEHWETWNLRIMIFFFFFGKFFLSVCLSLSLGSFCLKLCDCNVFLFLSFLVFVYGCECVCVCLFFLSMFACFVFFLSKIVTNNVSLYPTLFIFLS